MRARRSLCRCPSPTTSGRTARGSRRRARSVAIDHAALAAFEAAPAATLDPELHLVDGPPEDVARFMLTLDAINFGSGWFPTLRKRPGRSGYATIAAGAAPSASARDGPWTQRAAARARHARRVADDPRPAPPTTS